MVRRPLARRRKPPPPRGAEAPTNAGALPVCSPQDPTMFRSLALSLVCCALEQHLSLALVEGESGGPLEFDAGLARATQFGQKIAPAARQQVVAVKRPFGSQPIDQLQPGGGAEGHPDGNGTIQLHDRRRRNLSQSVVKRSDTRPISFLSGARASVTRGDGRLQCIWPQGGAKLLCPLQRRQATPDEQVIPACPILAQQQDRLAGRADSASES